jgi:hypothetical protein
MIKFGQETGKNPKKGKTTEQIILERFLVLVFYLQMPLFVV